MTDYLWHLYSDRWRGGDAFAACGHAVVRRTPLRVWCWAYCVGQSDDARSRQTGVSLEWLERDGQADGNPAYWFGDGVWRPPSWSGQASAVYGGDPFCVSMPSLACGREVPWSRRRPYAPQEPRRDRFRDGPRIGGATPWADAARRAIRDVRADDLRALGLRADFTATELVAAWRTAARRTHPDAGGTAAAFIATEAAYRRLRATCGESLR